MAHGSWMVQHRTTHGSWGGESVVWPMGHGWYDIHDPWVVQRCTMLYGPWVMGKKSLNGVLMTDSNGDDCAQGEDSKDEQVDADCPGENSHDDDDIEDDGVEDEIRQGTYGMGEY